MEVITSDFQVHVIKKLDSSHETLNKDKYVFLNVKIKLCNSNIIVYDSPNSLLINK